METRVPAMHRLVSLGPSGPFSKTSQPAWFFHGDGHVRYLDMECYRAGLIESGMPSHEANDAVGRMREHGARQLLWAMAHGGKGGHANVSWDVRVSATTSPAAEAVPAITGSSHLPLGASPISALADHDAVLVAYTYQLEPTKIRLPSALGPRWSRTLRLPAQIECHFTRGAFAALATGNVGATVVVCAGSLPAAEHGLRALVKALMSDVMDNAKGATQGGDDVGGR